MATWTYSPAGVDKSAGVAPSCIVLFDENISFLCPKLISLSHNRI